MQAYFTAIVSDLTDRVPIQPVQSIDKKLLFCVEIGPTHQAGSMPRYRQLLDPLRTWANDLLSGVGRD
jgi:hypothetical protein